MQTATCGPGEQHAVSDAIYFGTGTPTGVVTSGEWEEFLRTEVTPRFPQGLSVLRASGHWKGQDGIIVREDSFVLHLVHPGDEQSEAAVRAIASEYKSRFSQEAVLRVRSQACASF